MSRHLGPRHGVLAALSLGLIALAVLAWSWPSGDQDAVVEDHDASSERSNQAAGSMSERAEEGTTESKQSESVTVRQPAVDSDTHTTLRVVDASDRPVTSAHITVTKVARARAWRALSTEERISNTPHEFASDSNEAGEVHLPNELFGSDDEAVVLWITHREFIGEWRSIDELEGRPPGNHTVVLSRPATLTALVEDAAKLPARRATILLQGIPADSPLGGSPPDVSRSNDAAARLCYIRSVDAIVGTGTPLPKAPFDCGALAAASGRVSVERLLEPAREHTTFQLTSTFVVRPTITRQDDGPACEVALTCLGSVGQGLYVLGSIESDDHRAVGDVVVPVPDSGTVDVTVSASCGHVAAFRLDDVRAGEVRDVALTITPTEPSWIRTEDTTGAPVPGTIVSASWLERDIWRESRAVSDADGYAEVVGVGSHVIEVSATHTRFAAPPRATYYSYTAREQAPVITLERGRRVAGRVAHGEVPVHEFAIQVWTGDPREAHRFAYTDRSDGRFDLGMLPCGEMRLLAGSAKLGSSDPLVLPVGDVDVLDLELQVDGGRDVSVLVLDAVTGESIEGASILHHPTADGFGFSAVAPAVESDALGHAALVGAARSRIHLTTRADGYTKRNTVLPAADPHDSDQTITIGLSALASLRARVSPWPLDAYDQSWIGITGSITREFEGVGPNGDVSFFDLPAGRVTAMAIFPDQLILYEPVDLHPGRTSEVEIPATDGLELRVELEGYDVADAGQQLVVCWFVPYEESGVTTEYRTTVQQDGTAILRFLPEVEGYVRVELEDRTPLAQRSLTIDDLRSGVVQLRRATFSLDIDVVDAAGEPASGAVVYLVPPSVPVENGGWAVADTSGRARLATAARGPVRVFARDEGSISGVHSVDVEEFGDEILTVELLPTVDLTFRAPGAGDRADMVQLDLYLRDLEAWVASATTSQPARLTPRDYDVHLATPGLWLDEARVIVPPSGGDVAVKVRRLATLVVESSQGAALELTAFELTDRATNETVTERLASGRVWTVPAEGGAIEYRGLPAGDYRWKADLSDGTFRVGTVQLAPDERTTLTIPLD